MPGPSPDAFVRAHLAPVLVAAGFTGDKRTFRRVSDVGDVQMFAVFPERNDVGVAAFEVQCGVIIKRDSRWIAEDAPAPIAVPGIEHTQWTVLLDPPASSSLHRFTQQPHHVNFWAAEGVDDVRVAAELRDMVDRIAVPVLDLALSGERDGAALERPELAVMRCIAPFRG